MNEDEDLEDAEDVALPQLPANAKNYMTPVCYRRLLEERDKLVNVERPSVVNVVSWAASNGDRSENGDYLYGKRRLREIDRRIRFLNKRIEAAEVVDPDKRPPTDKVFFGATVAYENLADGSEHVVRIVGVDEADPEHGDVSWVSPIARVLMKASEGDEVRLPTPAAIGHPARVETLLITGVKYTGKQPY
ncbi:MAG: transcription elongation factor GreB [Duodenibacillus sp.]|nr:transcription elongation factor GreB [Duodenibacillus sp.]